VRRVKRERDASQVKRNLSRLKEAARGTENLMPYLLEAAKCYASLGEITRTLKAVWGEYREPIIV
jgi:methylmalonyl-CoA mutase N-terminal domain/subunit